jgi:hypothetical protein
MEKAYKVGRALSQLLFSSAGNVLPSNCKVHTPNSECLITQREQFPSTITTTKHQGRERKKRIKYKIQNK